MPEISGSRPDPGLWDFSLALYARPGAAEACLALQERHGTDVNLLLFCCWAGSRGRGLSGAELAGLIAVVSEWQLARLASHLQVLPLLGLGKITFRALQLCQFTSVLGPNQT